MKRLEKPCIYNIVSDELYELDEEAFAFFNACAGKRGCSADADAFLEFCIDEGLLIEKRAAKRRAPRGRSPVPSLRYLELRITDRCNLRCKHCYIGEGKDVELPLRSVEKVMREFEALQGLRLLITGGEPLLYRDFDSLNSMLPDFEFRKVLLTNGLPLNSKILEKLRVDEIQISVDGLEDAHDFIRGGGVFKRAMKAIERSLDAGFDVSVSTMIHHGNLKDFDDMERIFREMNIKEWTVDAPSLSGNLLVNPDIAPAPDIAGRYLNYGFGEGPHGGGDGYACGLHLMSVMPDGCAAKCSFYSDRPVGDIDEGLAVCWKRVEHVRLSEIECDCDFINECRGGCRYRASAFGSPYAKDPYKCEAFLRNPG